MFGPMSFTAKQGQRRLRSSAYNLISSCRLTYPRCIYPYLDNTLLGLDLSVANLAVVNDNGITTSTAGGTVSPSNALGELGIGVGKEELFKNMSVAN